MSQRPNQLGEIDRWNDKMLLGMPMMAISSPLSGIYPIAWQCSPQRESVPGDPQWLPWLSRCLLWMTTGNAAHQKEMRSQDQVEGGIWNQEGLSDPHDARREEGDLNVHQGNLEKGFIRPSHSSQTLAMFLILKKDGGKQIVTDYRHLNTVTVPSNYPFPLIS